MIHIRTYQAYWLAMATRISNLSRVIFVRSEDELAAKIKDVADGEQVLIAVIPSAETFAGDYDNIREKESGFVYSLIKVSRNNMNDDDEVTAMESTQNTIEAIKRTMLSDAANCESQYHSLMKNMDFNRMRTDPEYNFLGCDGYSLSFQFVGNGF